MDQTSLLNAALNWAERGVPVFPCASNKAPMTARGHLNASTDPDKVREMFEGVPDDTMIGARMGKESGLFACDFDLYKSGAEDYMTSLIGKGLLDKTQTHLTRSGGLHMIYKSDGQYPNCKPSAGVEIKGEGGYVIVPPSSGYSIEHEGIVTASTSLINELMAAQRKSSSSSVDSLKQNVLSGKDFHDALAQIAARRSAQGWAIEKVQKELIDVLKASAASEPNHPRHERWTAILADRGEELSRIVGTGNEKYNSSAKIEKVKENVSKDKASDFAGATAGIFSRPDPVQPGTQGPDVPDIGAATVGSWPFANAGYVGDAERDIRNQKYIAYPLLAEKESVLLAAEPKTGKTAIALTLAAAVAQGVDLTDAIKIYEARPVLYFTLEGARAVELRLQAMREDAKQNDAPPPNLEKLFVVDRPHNFLDVEQQKGNCANIALHSAKCQEEWGVDLGLIVIDTLTKAMPGGDQNSVEDTSQMFEMIGMLRSFGVDATIVFIHHLSKQGNVRGSTNIEAEVDVVLGVEKIKDSTDVWLNIRRARSINEELSYRWGFRSVDLGETIQGHSLSAPVVEIVGGDQAPTSGENAKEAMRWSKICKAITSLGEGYHGVEELAFVLNEWVPQPTGKRPNFYSQTVQKPLRTLLEGRFSWAFGKWHITAERTAQEDIKAVELRFTG